MILLTEVTNKIGNFNKHICEDGKLNSAANVVQARAKTVKLQEDNVAEYIDSLGCRYDTALVLGVYKDLEEYDIVTVGNESPSDGVISRSKDYFNYANSGNCSLVMLDFDGSHTEEVRLKFLEELDCILSDCLVGETGQSRSSILRWMKPSSSGSARINGKVGNGLHVYLAVKGANEKLVKLIHQFCWMQDYGKGWKMTAAATILPESLIDPAVGSPERVVYSADITCASDEVDFQAIERKCIMHPGGVLDCEQAINLLEDLTAEYTREWSTFKLSIENSPEVRLAKKEWKDKQIAKKVKAGLDKRTAKKQVKSLSEHILLSEEELLRNDGSTVLVSEVLRYPDEWIGVNKFCDPIKQEQHRNVGMILGEEEAPFLNSMNHGGVKYWLKWSFEGLSAWLSEADEDEVEDWFAIFLANSVCTGSQSDKLSKVAAKKLGATVAGIKSDVKEAIDNHQEASEGVTEDDSEEIGTRTTLDVEATHSDIIDDFIRRSGEECKGYGDGVYVWKKGSTIWNKFSAGRIKTEVRRQYSHVKLCKRVSDFKGITSEIVGEDSIRTDHWEQEYGIPCSDGFYRVSSEGVEKVEYTKELGCRFKIGFKPDNRETPYWDKVIENTENPVLFQQLFGLALSGYLHNMQKVFVMFGEGGAGKGTTNDVLKAMLPKGRLTSVPLDKLNDPKFLVGLVDSQVNIVSEVSEAKGLDLTGLKACTGHDMVTGWVLYRGDITFTPRTSFIINMNKWISLKQVGPEIKRRMGHSIVKFVKRHEEQIDGLSKKIIENELPGILAWALEGVRLYFAEGLWDVESLEYYGQWTSSVDPISLFFDEMCEFGPSYVSENNTCRVLRGEFWKRFCAFCEDGHYYAPRKGLFFERLEEMSKVKVDRIKTGSHVFGVKFI